MWVNMVHHNDPRSDYDKSLDNYLRKILSVIQALKDTKRDRNLVAS
jgi:hypothetical protein